MNIIFICKHNVFRSRVAEAYFKAINKNKKINATSGGLIKGRSNSKNQIKAIKEAGIKLVSEPKNISTGLLAKQDLTIITADDVPVSLFNNRDYNKKVMIWKVPDVLDDNLKNVEYTIKLIKNKVEGLIMELKKNDN